tara:strand:- start:28 stop:1026 length:999 start_codon:yes stop_codon:yes gene_type:complete
MKIFLTGGLGFIGSNLAINLVKLGHEVVIYDNFSTGTIENISSYKKEFKIIKGDILDLEKLNKSLKNIDLICHHAAQLEITKGINNPVFDLNQNTIGSLNIINAGRKNNVRDYVIASSAAVYGNSNQKSLTEKTKPKPHWEYGVSKLAVENYSEMYAEYEDLNFLNLRYSIVYGVNEWYGRVLTIFIKRVLEKKDLVIFGDGTATRDFVNVDDIVKLNVLAIDNGFTGNVVLNGSFGSDISILDLAKKVKKISKENFDFDPKIINENLSEGKYSKYVKGRMRLPRELNKLRLDNKLANKLYNWKPKTTLEDGILSEMNWINNNFEKWNKLSY